MARLNGLSYYQVMYRHILARTLQFFIIIFFSFISLTLRFFTLPIEYFHELLAVEIEEIDKHWKGKERSMQEWELEGNR